ncbi:SRPBCC domain-containing protein [Streptomyces pratensis]|uniref:SRPBCC domain-containing protein n=1 Tax=Streptomyces pratensis TaxID=1169025 RepID=UPI00301A9406
MEHEVYVPVPAPALRRALGDPARVARCVPGLQQDADASASPLAGRLKLRAGGHTITYRGELRLSGPDGELDTGEQRFSVTGEGVEARGSGAVKLALTIGLAAADDGTTLTYRGTVSGDGRLVELEKGAALAAAHRLLDRFTQQLVTESLAGHEEDATAAEDAPAAAEGLDAEGEGPGAEGADAEGLGAESAGVENADASGAEQDADAGGGADTDVGAGTGSDAAAGTGSDAAAGRGSDAEGSRGVRAGAGDGAEAAPGSGAGEGRDASGSVFDSPVPPPSLDPVAGVEFTVPDEPPAEAAHARRTMIGRSAEEVDHAPPRGRYAPVPSPESGGAGTTLRWVAPAAALALASAVVLGRALRRRR